MRINDLNKIILQQKRNVVASNEVSKSVPNNGPNLKKILGKRPHLKKTNVLKNVPRFFPKFENQIGSIKHSGDIGDLIYFLPVIRYLGCSDLFLNPRGLQTKKIDGTASGFNFDLIRILAPLLESQVYINSVLPWTNQPVNIDADYFRQVESPLINLCEKILFAFSIPFVEIDVPWIYVEPKKIASQVFSRSFRYRNEDMDYNKFITKRDDCVFIGLDNEYVDFCDRFGKIPYYPVKDFLELAQVIAGSETFYGNQSSPMAIAISMHKNFVQESFRGHPDCVFNLKHAKYII